MPVKTTWGHGDYPRMAERLMPAAAAAVDAAELRAGDHVLDLACGTGNAALLAARSGARVTGVDIEPRLLEIARQRAHDAGLTITFSEGDASALGRADPPFSCILSVFGVMYAADPSAAARQMARCTTADAGLVLTAWSPGSFMPALGGVLAPYLPPPDGLGPPSAWGARESVTAILGPAGFALATAEEAELRLQFADDDEATEFLIETAGHVAAERARLHAEGRWSELVADVRTLVATSRQCAEGPTILRLDYLLTRWSKIGAHGRGEQAL
jgi:SAM-dependent methyltransferase